jgi:O-methyltransferase
MKLLDPRSFSGAHFNVRDVEKFKQGFALIKESLFDGGNTIFSADNMITWNRNLSFLRDDFFIDILKGDQSTPIEKSVVWRLYILLYFAQMASSIEGDYVELGCHTGHTAEHVLKKINLAALDKEYFLYDLFEWKDGDEHTRMPGHYNQRMYEDVKAKFRNHPYVKIIKGSVPESFAHGFPKKIAFAHIDMNHPVAEEGALKHVLPVLSKGGIVIFDDYGWWGYSAQKIALDPVIHSYSLQVLELPTGQALLMNR